MCVWKRNQVTDFGYIHNHSSFSKFRSLSVTGHVNCMYSFFCDFFFGPHSHSTSKTAISLRTMSSETKESDAGFRSFSYEEELQRAKWFKEDLERGKCELNLGEQLLRWIQTLFANDISPLECKSFTSVFCWKSTATKRQQTLAEMNRSSRGVTIETIATCSVYVLRLVQS